MTTLGTGHCFRATDFACSIFDVQVGHVMINFLHRCILNLVRIASVAGKGQRPAIAISESFDVYVGNDGTSALTLDASELFGFNVGAFDYKVVRNVDAQTSAIPWRLQDDFSLVAVEGKLYPLCEFLHHCVTQKGLAEIGVEDHKVASQYHLRVPLQESILCPS